MPIAVILAALVGQASAPPAPAPAQEAYRLPYADGTQVSVFDDTASHRPRGALDLVGEPRDASAPHRIVAAAEGVVMAIQDGYAEQQSGRAAAACRNNFVWIGHPNGEWTLYSHMRQGTTRGKAGLDVGSRVRAGQYLGDEGAVGCAMLPHLHFEVAVPATTAPIDALGFLNDNADRGRLRSPSFCGVPGGAVAKDKAYLASPCRTGSEPSDQP